MVWVKLPCVHDATLLGCWHLELQTPIVLGGRANVECISSVQHPAGVDGGVIVDKTFSSDQRDWCFGEVIRTVDLLVGRFVEIPV
jgi:hypothetical protein